MDLSSLSHNQIAPKSVCGVLHSRRETGGEKCGLAGLCVGLFLWAFFPYKTRPEEQAQEEVPEDAEESD